jgi:hypothetical protein
MQTGLVALLTGAAMVLSAAPAMAETSNIYDNFTGCPTSSPAMNDPAADGVVCSSSLIRGGLLKVGNFQAPITSPLHIQFAMVFKEEELTVVPGSTIMESAPFLVPNPFFVPPSSPVAAASSNGAQSPQVPAGQGLEKPKQKKVKHKKKKGKKHHKKKHHKKRHHRKKRHRKHPAPVPPVSTPPPPAAETPPAAESEPFVKATVEPVGDIDKLNLAAVFGGAGSLFRTATKIHLEGSGLGPSCYIGTDAEPIYIEPLIVSPPLSAGIAQDPNGLPVEVLSLSGMTLEDGAFAVPGASGCGVVDPATQAGSLDPQVNALLGLPAVPGGAKVIFSNTLFEMAAAENDGTPPDGGAQLQEAFEAAK